MIIVIVINTLPYINSQHPYVVQLWRCMASVKGVKRVVGDNRDDLMCYRHHKRRFFAKNFLKANTQD